MKSFVAFVAVILMASALATEDAPRSEYRIPANRFRLMQRSDGGESGVSAQFSGKAVLDGMLVVKFDRFPEHPEDDLVGIALFKPNKRSMSKLPNVIAGPHPIPPSEIELENEPPQLLKTLLGKSAAAKVLHAKTARFETPATISIQGIGTSVECDSRHYSAKAVAIYRRSAKVVAHLDGQSIGC